MTVCPSSAKEVAEYCLACWSFLDPETPDVMMQPATNRQLPTTGDRAVLNTGQI
jgi:hypothetical protein